jgi:hypothetical protein
VPAASIEPDTVAQVSRLFDESFDADATVMLTEPPPDAAGSPGPPAMPSARILIDGEEAITIEASAGVGGGYLVLTDSYDRSWRVSADGGAAPLLRANGLYRAVRLQPGTHTVTFAYKPDLLYACALVSGLAASVMALAALLSLWRQRRGLVVAATSPQTAV